MKQKWEKKTKFSERSSWKIEGEYFFFLKLTRCSTSTAVVDETSGAFTFRGSARGAHIKTKKLSRLRWNQSTFAWANINTNLGFIDKNLNSDKVRLGVFNFYLLWRIKAVNLDLRRLWHSRKLVNSWKSECISIKEVAKLLGSPVTEIVRRPNS